MRSQPTPSRRLTASRTRGFTLVELLLAVTLLAGLMAAAIFGFSSLHRSAQLNEGVERVETAMRFARAHAANTGRKVQVVVATGESTRSAAASPARSSEGASSGSLSNDRPDSGTISGTQYGSQSGHSLSILWESDPSGAPGVFEPIPSLSTEVADVSELVEIRSVDRGSTKEIPPVSDGSSGGPGSTAASVPTSDGLNAGAASASDTLASSGAYETDSTPDRRASAGTSREPRDGEATITFYPDGSCDGATIVLGSRDGDDAREVAVHLESVTGTTRRQWREAAGASADSGLGTSGTSTASEPSSLGSPSRSGNRASAAMKPRR